MSLADVRLDAATLREVLSAVDRYSERMAGSTTSRRAAQRGVVAACKDIAAQLRGELAEAASLSPALSDWLRAGDSSHHGPLRWRGRTYDDSGWLLGWSDSMGMWSVLLAADGTEATTAVVTTDTRHPCDDDVQCATPADLRAALERLAAEAGR